jgi:hypothetical protein
VIDFKYGQGVPVSATDNPQLKLYAVGALPAVEMFYDINKVSVHIFQPRLESVTSETYTVEELKEWTESIKGQAQKAWDGVGEFKSGEWCQFCGIAGNCRYRMEQEAEAAFEDVFIEPEDVIDLDAHTLTDEQVIYWLGKADGIIKFLNSVKDFALKEAVNHDKHYEGYKLVEGKSNRRYIDDEIVISALKAAGAPEGYLLTKLVGVTELKKLIGAKMIKTVIDPLLVKPQGKPTLVPVWDKRDALEKVEGVFDEIEEEHFED